jgi:tether containing UBX domain for GLUT4
MVESDKKRVEQNIVICLQLEDGSRLNQNYHPSKSLHEIITDLCPEKSSDDQNPIVIYMRSEYHGESLKTTTLKSLGLNGGSALLRLINSDPESLKVQANVSAPLPQKPKEEQEVKSVEKPMPKAQSMKSDAFQLKSAEDLKPSEEKKVKVEEQMEVDEQAATATIALEDGENKEKLIESTPNDETKIEEEVIEDPVINILDDRGTIIFSLDSIQTFSNELPDSFFELTESEVRRLYQDLRNQVEEMNNAPLMTLELRKLEENKKILNQLATYKSCAVRIQFPNRYVIQTKFSTVDTISAVMNFVKDFLINPDIDFYFCKFFFHSSSDQKFYFILFFFIVNFYFFPCRFELDLTPPKTILDKDLTLVEANCVPSALLHFGCDQTTDLLKPEYLDKLSSGTGASRVLLKSNDKQSSSSAPSTSSSLTATSSSQPKNFMESKASAKPSGNVPKWFKTNK